MTKAKTYDQQPFRRNEALLRTVLVHGVPVRTMATALGVSRQTVYRRMQQARVQMRRLAEAAEREVEL
jgi:DNA-directed RNA polymerase specialized sigma24 family protein